MTRKGRKTKSEAMKNSRECCQLNVKKDIAHLYKLERVKHAFDVC